MTYLNCVPYYIVEEIVDYVELIAKGYSKFMKWENIRSLLKLAIINNNLAKEQEKFIEEVNRKEILQNIKFL